MRRWFLISSGLALVALGLGAWGLASCSRPGATRPGTTVKVPASKAFWKHWSDGRAEVTGYRTQEHRYGHLRSGTTVLIYVTEEVDGRTWVKDDRGNVPAKHKRAVLKLNRVQTFRTGIYPYRVMTSIFAPVNGGDAGPGRERFSPAKISHTAQEWCGHVFLQLKPWSTHYRSELHSYFGGEGDRKERVSTSANTLYEDALLIQLRELDGPFAGGGNWSGELVPSLWASRKSHKPLRPVRATITRTQASLKGVPVTRFRVQRGAYWKVYDVERASPRRVLAWRDKNGATGQLLKTARLPYWRLNTPGAESHLTKLGLTPLAPRPTKKEKKEGP